ncbi:MAG: PEP/pyruvate-binding domain-containing protein, partial [Chloroflexia bacterium]
MSSSSTDIDTSRPEQPAGPSAEEDEPLVLPFSEIDAGMLLQVGGKGANLGELSRAGLPVPDGFCMTTAAYRLISDSASLAPVLDELAGADPGDSARLQEGAARARDAILGADIPSVVEEAIREAYGQLSPAEGPGDPAVAVRSSATAEDLQFASFAGQQDTFLNVVGADALIDAVKRCWASLWTDRAVSYRASNNVDQRTVRLAVVVQHMVDAAVAGVLFTANPLTGKRRQAVLDASPGLGEAVVSGAVNPDRFVVDVTQEKIVERQLGDKRVSVRSVAGGGTERVESASGSDTASLTDEQVVALAHLGEQVEAHFGAPQDIEWAIDEAGVLWLTQSRPITTLYPLPAGAPTSDDDLRVYFSINVAQGVYRPFTPMGLATFRLMISSGARLAGFPPPDPVAGPRFLVDAGQRLFADMTFLVRSEVGRRLLSGVMGQMEARSGVVFRYLTEDPHLSLMPTPRSTSAHRLRRVLPRIRRAPLYALQALISPRATRRRLRRVSQWVRGLGTVPGNATSEERLDAFERMLVDTTAPLIVRVVPLVVPIFGLPTLLSKLLGDLATPDERQTVFRSLPYNPTTEMDLVLWKLSRRISGDARAAALFQDLTPAQLAARYHEGNLPPVLLQGLSDFMRVYGHRAIAEIDLGLPRWSEDPTHILGVLANYLQLKDENLAPDVQFKRGAVEARAMGVELTRRAGTRGRLRGALVGFVINRIRNINGLREVP